MNKSKSHLLQGGVATHDVLAPNGMLALQLCCRLAGEQYLIEFVVPPRPGENAAFVVFTQEFPTYAEASRYFDRLVYSPPPYLRNTTSEEDDDR